MRHTIARAAHLLGTARFLLGRCEDVLAGVRGFRMPESDPSWEELGKAWEHRAGEAIPASWSLREHLAHRWVRFHRLPGSKRDAETEAEEEILLDRHHEVLAALRGSSTDEVLVVLLRWDGQGAFRASREFRRIASTWSFWRTFVDGTTDDDENEAITASAFVRRLPATRAALDPWFRRAADDADVFVITDDAVDWVYAPYDGGADVVAPNTRARDILRAEFATWLSARPDGL